MAIPYFDAHCDTIWRCMAASGGDDGAGLPPTLQTGSGLLRNEGHVDLTRDALFARRGQFFALYDDVKRLPDGTAWRRCCQMHDWFTAQLAENSGRIALCRSGAEADAAVAAGKTAAFLSVEGADLLDCGIEQLQTAAGWGVRLVNMVWNHANVLGGSCADDPDRGLSPQGRNFLRELERLGVYADVSHLSDPGFWDVFRMTERPMVASHSDARALCPHRRNLTDDMFRAVRDTGGVVGLNLYRDFVGGASMDALVAHAEHFLSLGGEKTLCIGGDLDGSRTLAAGMRGMEDVPQLYRALEKRGYGKALLEDIFWNNLRRLL